MIIIVNLILIAIALLIAYWWANQGFFSALLHLVCVVVAGATAFAVWEPLTFLLMKGSWFDNYVWGVTLLSTFVVSLLIMRILMDKLVPANVRLPRWADLSFGGIAGVAAAVLTVGTFLVGAGHMQSSQKLMGFQEYGRSERDGHVGRYSSRALWIPFHRITTDFYGQLSVTSFDSPWGSLRHDAPDLYKQVSLIRDSYDEGKGMISLRPEAATVDRIASVDANGKDHWLVTVSFNLKAQDFGERLTLSRSQIRLIGAPTSRRGAAPVVHPVAWLQHSGYHEFDNTTHYVTNEPGKELSTTTIEFEAPAGFQPRYVQIRGTRFALPATAEPPAPFFLAARAAAKGDTSIEPPTGGAVIDEAIEVTNSIRPLNISSNTMPSTLNETDDHYLTSGTATITRTRSLGSRKLKIQGIYEPEGTRCVRVDISRSSVADIFRFVPQEGDEGELALVDSEGTEYRAIGYFYKVGSKYTISLQPTKRVRTPGELPVVPTSGDNQLWLLFYVTVDKTITGFRYGNTNIGNCSVRVEADSR